MGVSWNPCFEDWALACGSRVHGWICGSEVGTERAEWRRLACWPDDPANREQIRTHLTRRYAPIVEMGAGTGYWARCLRERGVEVIAYDEMGDSWRAWFGPTILAETTRDRARRISARAHPEWTDPFLWTEVRQGGPDVLARHADHTLLLCWPDPWSGFDEASLGAYPGDHLALVGAGHGSDDFCDLLARDWRPIDRAHVPRWDPSDDHLVVYGRR